MRENSDKQAQETRENAHKLVQEIDGFTKAREQAENTSGVEDKGVDLIERKQSEETQKVEKEGGHKQKKTDLN